MQAAGEAQRDEHRQRTGQDDDQQAHAIRPGDRVVRLHHDNGNRPRPGTQRDRQRHDRCARTIGQFLSFLRRLLHTADLALQHRDRHQQQEHAPRGPERRQRNTEQGQDPLAQQGKEHKRDEDGRRCDKRGSALTLADRQESRDGTHGAQHRQQADQRTSEKRPLHISISLSAAGPRHD